MLVLDLYLIICIFFFIISLFIFVQGSFFLVTNYSIVIDFIIFTSNSVNINYVVYIDWISLRFISVVLCISSIVILYRKVYIGGIYRYDNLRFLLLVCLFVLRILLIIISPNLIRILLGWDGLGLISYCLVIYYNSLKSYLAGILTCLINRLGDIGLLISISWIFRYGSWNFIYYTFHLDSILFYIVIISSFTKRAQIPFSSWLPAAMAAPTPVSALVHSSTLVTAGVYLLIRFFNYLIFCQGWLFLLLRLITLLMSSICARFEFDLKKIIALSTLRQLGLIIRSLFIGQSNLTFFHLLSHAMFKSLLFLCAGIIIHFINGFQDIRIIGCISFSLPITCTCFNISNMALCGFPFLSGFYSKDYLVESFRFRGISFFCIFFIYFSLGITVLYSFRLFYYSIISNFNFSRFFLIVEDISYIKIRLIVLTLFSVLFGCGYLWYVDIDLIFLALPLFIKLLSLLIVISGFLVGLEICLFYNYYFNYSTYFFNGSIWFIYSYSRLLFNLFYNSANILSYSLFWGEFYGGIGLSFFLLKLSNLFQSYNMYSFKVFLMFSVTWFLFLLYLCSLIIEYISEVDRVTICS